MAGQQIDVLLAGIRDTSSQPLNAGKVYTYEAGTSTPKATYVDQALVTPEANPIILDAYGRKQVYADGAFKFLVKDSADALIYTWDNLYYSRVGSALSQWTDIWAGTSGGSANAYTLTVPLAMAAYAAGQQITFIPNAKNTGASTANANGLGVVNLKNELGGDLLAGDLDTSKQYTIIHDGTNFRLVNPFGHLRVISRNMSFLELVNSGTETDFFSYNVPANSLGVQRGLRFSYLGQITNNVGSNQTVTLRLKYGATTIYSYVDTIATGTTTGYMKLNAEMMAAGVATAQRLWVNYNRGPTLSGTGTESAATTRAFVGESPVEDSTLAKDFKLTCQLSGGDPNLSAYRLYAILELL